MVNENSHANSAWGKTRMLGTALWEGVIFRAVVLLGGTLVYAAALFGVLLLTLIGLILFFAPKTVAQALLSLSNSKGELEGAHES